MSGKKIDTSQIKSTDFSSAFSQVLQGDQSNYTNGLLQNIKSDDKSKAAISSCSAEMIRASKGIGTALENLNTYINDMADAFANADKQIANQISDIEVSAHNSSTPSKKNAYRDVFMEM